MYSQKIRRLAGMMALCISISISLTLHAQTHQSNHAAEETHDALSTALNNASDANFRHDIEQEREILKAAEQLAGTVEDRADVQQRLAVLDWRYAANFDAARKRLQKAAADFGTAETWLAMARMELAAGRYKAAREAANKAMGAADTETLRQQAYVAAARPVVAGSIIQRSSGQPIDAGLLTGALQQLDKVVGGEAGTLESARLLMQAALLLGDGATALHAWRAYFQLAPGQPLPNAIADGGAVLERVLKKWSGPGKNDTDDGELIQALQHSRFFTEADLIARHPNIPEAVLSRSNIQDLLNYVKTIKNLRAHTEEYYRQTSIGSGDLSAYVGQAASMLREMVATMHDPKAGSVTSNEDISAYLENRYGAYVNFGNTAGYFDLHMGYSIIDETRTVEQYGNRAELRFVVLDNMVSNGFQSWAWEGGAEHGGWANSDAIYQVRSAYADNPMQAWRQLNATVERDKFIAEMQRESALDDQRATDNAYAFLPGLEMRLRHQGRTRLLQRLRDNGYQGEQLRLKFMQEIRSAVRESSIFAHEGRHAIDNRAGEASSDELEYTAKLAEVAFAPEPRLTFGGIFAANIGDPTSHGQANLKVVKGVVAWMQQHQNEINGFDAGRPVLPQFDLLSDTQMRSLFRSMDPLYKLENSASVTTN